MDGVSGHPIPDRVLTRGRTGISGFSANGFAVGQPGDAGDGQFVLELSLSATVGVTDPGPGGNGGRRGVKMIS